MCRDSGSSPYAYRAPHVSPRSAPPGSLPYGLSSARSPLASSSPWWRTVPPGAGAPPVPRPLGGERIADGRTVAPWRGGWHGWRWQLPAPRVAPSYPLTLPPVRPLGTGAGDTGGTLAGSWWGWRVTLTASAHTWIVARFAPRPCDLATDIQDQQTTVTRGLAPGPPPTPCGVWDLDRSRRSVPHMVLHHVQRS